MAARHKRSGMRLRHWERGTVDAQLKDGVATVRTQNVAGLWLNFSTTDEPRSIVIDGAKVVRPADEVVSFRKVKGAWQAVVWKPGKPGPQPDGSFGVTFTDPETGLAKKPDLQGPIDDAFMSSFVMVKPTGRPMNSKTAEWAEKEMKHATEHWRKQFRGDAPVKADTEITDADIKNSNLILWGDPMSNALLAKIADKLPIKWPDRGVQVGDKTYEAGTHVPVLIYPNPLNPAKYVVLNSGFTFREYDYLNNARQVSKLPDYAVIDITTPPNARYPGKVVRAGFFGEKWELLENDGK